MGSPNGKQIGDQANGLTNRKNKKDGKGKRKNKTKENTPLKSPLTERKEIEQKSKMKMGNQICSMLWSVRSCQPNSSTGQLYNQGRSCSGYPMSPRRGMVQSKLATCTNDLAGSKRTGWFFTPACPVQFPRLTRNLHRGEEPGTYPIFNIAELNSKSGFILCVAPCQGTPKP
jgi:hypothetical protein